MARNDDSWRKCVSWLTHCGVLRADHKANWRDAVVLDLANTLRDGVLLCSLCNVLDPGCIDMKDVNQKPQLAQFLCLRNIKVFLHMCHVVFGLKETDLFEPSMLYELTDFYKVLNTLSKLSNCPKVQRRNIPGNFTEVGHLSSVMNKVKITIRKCKLRKHFSKYFRETLGSNKCSGHPRVFYKAVTICK